MSEIITPTIADRTEEHFQEILNGSHYRNQDEKVECQSFTLFPNYVEAKIGSLKKAISLLDFKALIDGLLQVDSKLVQLALPFNCFTFAKSASEIHLSCYHPERITTIQHIDRNSGKTKSYKIPFPNTIVSAKLSIKDNLWNVSGVKYFCTNKKVTQLPEDSLVWERDPAKGIWLMPFPNFYENGHMCYGRNTMPSKYSTNLRGLDFYYQVIFESAFNDDLGITGTINRYNPTTWFEKLSKLSEFPYDELRKS